jgi:hypothetical protein
MLVIALIPKLNGIAKSPIDTAFTHKPSLAKTERRRGLLRGEGHKAMALLRAK